MSYVLSGHVKNIWKTFKKCNPLHREFSIHALSSWICWSLHVTEKLAFTQAFVKQIKTFSGEHDARGDE